MRRVTAAALAGAALLLAAGCSSSSSSSGTTSSGSGSGNTNADPAPVTVRLGFLENITHASALVGLKEGFFNQALGSAGTLKPTAFSTGTQETVAILAGQLDAAYVGPNPAINAWQKSGGSAIKIVSGAATGGASVVVKAGITSAGQLKGKTLATPSLGNTQDVALRYWLKQNGVTTTTTGGGDAFIKPTTPNSAAVLEFQSGQIAGGSEPAANDFIKSNPAAAQADANSELASFTGKPLKASLVAAAFKEITFTDDPDASSLTTDASQAVSLGLLKPVNLSGIFDLGPLNTALAAAGESQVSS